jgi:hypothetical protein
VNGDDNRDENDNEDVIGTVYRHVSQMAIGAGPCGSEQCQGPR